MHLAVISKTTFYNYQRHFICPIVNTFYIQQQVCELYIVFSKVFMISLQSKLIKQYKTKDLVLCGDGRYNSPGKSAKFCTYSLMESEDNVILHFVKIDKCEVDLCSPNMEREGMVKKS